MASGSERRLGLLELCGSHATDACYFNSLLASSSTLPACHRKKHVSIPEYRNAGGLGSAEFRPSPIASRCQADSSPLTSSGVPEYRRRTHVAQGGLRRLSPPEFRSPGGHRNASLLGCSGAPEGLRDRGQSVPDLRGMLARCPRAWVSRSTGLLACFSSGTPEDSVLESGSKRSVTSGTPEGKEPIEESSKTPASNPGTAGHDTSRQRPLAGPWSVARGRG